MLIWDRNNYPMKMKEMKELTPTMAFPINATRMAMSHGVAKMFPPSCSLALRLISLLDI